MNCGVDVERFSLALRLRTPRLEYVFVGTLTDRKNVVRLADAFERLGDENATLTIVGEGPLRPALSGRRGVSLVGAVPHDEVPEHMAAARVVCQPSLVEPMGQALLEAMAIGGMVPSRRTSAALRSSSPRSRALFVDPLDVDAIARGLAAAAALPCPNPAARAPRPRATTCAARRSGSKRSSSEPPASPPAGRSRQGQGGAFAGFPPTTMMAYTAHPMIAPPIGPTM